MKSATIARLARPAAVALALLTGSLAGAVPTAYPMDPNGSFAQSSRLYVGAGGSASVSFSLRAGAVGKIAEAARLTLGSSAGVGGLEVASVSGPAGIELSLDGAAAYRTSEGEPLVRLDATLAAGVGVLPGAYPLEVTLRNTITGETAVVGTTVVVGLPGSVEAATA